MIHLRTAPLVALLALAACGGRDAAPGVMPRERFIAANVALRSIPDTAADADSLRARALRRHRVTERDLLAFVRAQRDDEALSEIWGEIAMQVERETAKRDSVERASQPTRVIDAAADAAVAEGLPGAPEIAPPPPVPAQAAEVPPPTPNADPSARAVVKPPRRVDAPAERIRPPTERIRPPTERIRAPTDPPADATTPWVPAQRETLQVRTTPPPTPESRPR